jgi:hypothetical protein
VRNPNMQRFVRRIHVAKFCLKAMASSGARCLHLT